jgi:hypothetical protein
MGFSYSRRYGVLGFLLVATLTASNAFVPNTGGFRPALVTPLVLSKSGTRTCPSSQTTALQMGVMEDFVAGSDAKTRQKGNDKYLAGLQKRVETINALEPAIEDLGDDELQAKTKEFRDRLAKGEDINGPLLEEAFAIVREAAWYVVFYFSKHRIWSFHLYCIVLIFSLCNFCLGVCWNSVITTCRSWEDSSFMKVDWPKWQRVKVKPWYPHFPSMSTP